MLVPHVEERMEERGFTEIDVGSRLEEATTVVPSKRQGRWRVPGRVGGQAWVVVVESEPLERVPYVVTAYPRG